MVLAAVGLVVAMVCALPGHAPASTTEKASLLDDDQLIYVSTQHMVQTLETLRATPTRIRRQLDYEWTAISGSQ